MSQFELEALAAMVVAEIPLIPVIVALIQALKKMLPLKAMTTEERDRLWYTVSFGLGILGELAVYVGKHGGSFQGWDYMTTLLAVLLGVVGGLAAGKAYDEAAARGLLASSTTLIARGHK